MRPYNYARRQGIKDIPCKRFALPAGRLTKQVAVFEPELLIGITRSGLIPPTVVACALQSKLTKSKSKGQ